MTKKEKGVIWEGWVLTAGALSLMVQFVQELPWD
jgi:hypothetical protein